MNQSSYVILQSFQSRLCQAYYFMVWPYWVGHTATPLQVVPRSDVSLQRGPTWLLPWGHNRPPQHPSFTSFLSCSCALSTLSHWCHCHPQHHHCESHHWNYSVWMCTKKVLPAVHRLRPQHYTNVWFTLSFLSRLLLICGIGCCTAGCWGFHKLFTSLKFPWRLA